MANNRIVHFEIPADQPAALSLNIREFLQSIASL